MQVLQPSYALNRTVTHCDAKSLATRQGRRVADLLRQGEPSDDRRIGDGLAAFRGVDDEVDLLVLHHVRHVRTTLGYLVYRARDNTGLPQYARGAAGSGEFEAQRRELPAQGRDERPIRRFHAHKSLAAPREHFARREGRLGERLREGVADAHHLAGGLHFRTEYGVDPRELDEREDRLFHADVVRNRFMREALLFQCHASHATRRDLGERRADALGNERHRAGGTGIDFDDVHVAILHGKLHVHQADDAEFDGDRLDLLPDRVLDPRVQTEWRQGAGGVPGVNSGLFDMLHDRTDHNLVSVGNGVDVHFHGLIEKPVQQYRCRVRYGESTGQIPGQFPLRVDDLHRPASEHVGRPEDHGEPDLACRHEAFVEVRHGPVGRLFQADFFDHGLEPFPVLRAVDRIRARADDGHSRSMQPVHEFQGRLATELHDDPFRALNFDDGQDILERYRLEVQAVRRVVVGGNGLRVAIDHDRLEPVLAHGQRRVNAAVVELDTLADPVRAPAEHHDLSGVARRRFTLLFEGGIEVCRACRKLRRAGVHPLEDRRYSEPPPALPYRVLAAAREFRETLVRKPVALQALQCLEGQAFDAGDRRLAHHQVLDLGQEPGIDARNPGDLLDGHAEAERVRHVKDAIRSRLRKLVRQAAIPGVRRLRVQYRIQARHARFQAPERFLERLLESAPDRHHFAHRLHLGGEAIRHLAELLEREPGNLRDDVVDGGLEGCRRDTGDVVGEFVQRIADGELGGHLRNGESRRLGGQRRRAGNARVHLDHHQASGLRVHRELHVGASGFDTDFPQHGNGGIAHALVFLVGQGLRGRDRDRVPGMHTHRVHVLDRAHDDAVVALVPDHFHLELFPAEQRFVDQEFVGRRQVQPPDAYLDEFFAVVSDTAAAAAQCERRPDHAGKPEPGLHLQRFLQAVRDRGPRRFESDTPHRPDEALAVFRLVDGFLAGADQLDAVGAQNALPHQVQGTVERGLSAHRGQQGIRLFDLDDARHGTPFDRLDVGRIRHGRIRHDRGRVRVHENDAVALVAQRLARLGTGVVELARLADDDRTRAENQNAFDVVTSGHQLRKRLLRSVLSPMGRSRVALILLRVAVHQRDKRVKQPGTVPGTRTRFGMALETERRPVLAPKALHRAIEQRHVGGLEALRQACFIHGEPVVLARDDDLPGTKIAHRMVRAMVPVRHLHGLRATRECEKLVAEADSEDGDVRSDDLANGVDRVITRVRITRAVRQEYTVRVHLKHFLRWRLRRHQRYGTTAVGQQPQYVVLDSKVVGNDATSGRRGWGIATLRRPHAFPPRRRVAAADNLREIHALKSRKSTRASQCLSFIGVRSRQDTAPERTLLADQPRQAPRVDIGDRDNAPAPQEFRQRGRRPPTAGTQRQVPDHEPFRPDPAGLHVLRIGARVADVGVGERHDLTGVGWIGEDLLVAGHGGIENDFANSRASRSNGGAVKQTAVRHGQYRGISACQTGLRRKKAVGPGATATANSK